MDHPLVTQIERTGYPNIIDQPEQNMLGFDFFGDEILGGDEFVEYDGELILVDNLNRYLSEEMGFEFKTA
ncbi:YqaI family protein [Cytobacillus horneckiae]|uniref:YqaI family protein n=1 Tax=Cytobacillus horneckiae TaxID=549687 RepID=UPI003D9A5AB1